MHAMMSSTPESTSQDVQGQRSPLFDVLLAREFVLTVVVVLAFAGMCIWEPTFHTRGNVVALVIGMAPETIVAVAMTVLIVSGAFDLSVGSLMMLCPIVAYLLLRDGPTSRELAILCGLGAAILSGTGFVQMPWLRGQGPGVRLGIGGVGGVAVGAAVTGVLLSLTAPLPAVIAAHVPAVGDAAPLLVALAAGLTTGATAGLCNGIIVTKARVNPLIATLGMMEMARGLGYVLTNKLAVTQTGCEALGQGWLVPNWVPVSAVVMIVVVAVGDVCLRRLRAMRQVYYIGGNEIAARLSGIRVEEVRVAAFMLSGTLAALAGLVIASRLGSATTTAGEGAELRIIAAVVIGGASLAGGEGSVLGAFLGCALMALIGNALNHLDVSTDWQKVVTGAVLVAAVSVDMLLKQRRGR